MWLCFAISSFPNPHKRANVYCPVHFPASTSILVSDLSQLRSYIVEMETKLITFSFCWLLAIAHSSPHALPSIDPEEEIYDLSPEEAGNFFRFLLLSKYGLDSSDYPAPDQVLGDDERPMSFDDEEQPMSFDVVENPMSFDVVEKPMSFDVKENPMDFDAEERLFSFDTDDMPFGSEDLARDTNFGNSVHPFKQAVQKFQVEQSTTVSPPHNEMSTEDASTTTSAPDVLASMPPVSPDKGQKEFVMLRPPTDNHRKIEHWMEEMANDLGLQAHTVQKRRFAM